MTPKWHKGPPPHIGWWNASVSKYCKTGWRWWNGVYWSAASFPHNTIKEVAENAKIGIHHGNEHIKWTTYWPKNARVPRVKP
jgi:hypothetical protein